MKPCPYTPVETHLLRFSGNELERELALPARLHEASTLRTMRRGTSPTVLRMAAEAVENSRKFDCE
jgi:hypothetical protein